MCGHAARTRGPCVHVACVDGACEHYARGKGLCVHAACVDGACTGKGSLRACCMCGWTRGHAAWAKVSACVLHVWMGHAAVLHGQGRSACVDGGVRACCTGGLRACCMCGWGHVGVACGHGGMGARGLCAAVTCRHN